MTKQPVQVIRGEQVRCCFCRTDPEHSLPDSELPISPNHWGVRFRHRVNLALPERIKYRGELTEWTWRICLDGQEIPLTELFEFESGRPGWVVRYWTDENGKKVICRGPAEPEHALAFIQRGHVTAEQVPIPPG